MTACWLKTHPAKNKVTHSLCCFLITEAHKPYLLTDLGQVEKKRFCTFCTDENIKLLSPNKGKIQPQHSFSCSHTRLQQGVASYSYRFVEKFCWSNLWLWSLTTRFICARGWKCELTKYLMDVH